MKLNKKTLRDLIYEILIEQEQAAPDKVRLKTGVMSQAQQRAGAIERTKGLKGVHGAEISIISQFEELLNNLAQGADLTKHKPALQRIMQLLQKAVPQEETGDSQLQEEGPDLRVLEMECRQGNAAACAELGQIQQGALREEGPGLEHYEKLCEQGDQRACDIAASMQQRTGGAAPAAPRGHPGMAGGMEEGRRRTKRVLRRRK